MITYTTVEVTPYDIDNGGHCGGNCPVAVAASRAFDRPVWATREHLLEARVDMYGTAFMGDDIISILPRRVRDWISLYDHQYQYYRHDCPVLPITFDIAVVTDD